MDAQLARLVETSRAVAATAARRAKVDRLAGYLSSVPADHVHLAAAYLAGQTRQGRIGIGPAALAAALDAAGTAGVPGAPDLTLADVDAAFERIAGASGAGSSVERVRLLAGVLARATAPERDFLSGLVLGEVRHGALEAVLVEAIARAANVPATAVRRAVMLTGDVAATAYAALHGGRAALDGIGIRLFRPVQPMLAQSADDVADAVARLGAAAHEFKLDGARIQVHRAGHDVRVYTRNLNDVTAAVPELVESVLTLPARELVLDGEAIALRADGTPHAFQMTMRRFGRRLDVESLRRDLPLAPLFFDVLRVDGQTLIDRPASERFDALESLTPPDLRVPRMVTAVAAEAAAFLDRARAAGHEGIVAKALDASYDAGRRGGGWLKVKPANTLDLVILAAEWGHGRRAGWLSNLHLGARDPVAGGFVMLGKTFTGLTDEMLAWQTRRLQELEVARGPYTVHVRPELVAEIAFNEVQQSPRYPGGLALRFARVKAYRPDKRPDEADTIDTVREIWRRQGG